MLISITAPNQQNFTSVSSFSHHSELNEFASVVLSSHRIGAHAGRPFISPFISHRGRNLGHELEGFTKFLTDT